MSRRVMVILSVFVGIVIAFYGGGLAYKHSIYDMFPGIRYLLDLFEPRAFYPGPPQDNSPLFEKTDVTYPYTFVIYGDSRELAFSEKSEIIDRLITEKPSFVVHLGDMTYCADSHQWGIFDAFDRRIIRNGIPMYPVLGNHEYRTRKEVHPANPEKQLQYYFSRFTFLNNRRWYSFMYGDSVFLVLDTNTDYSPGSEQYRWLVKMLERKVPGFLFVSFHHPPYTKGYHQRMSERLLAKLIETHGKERPVLPAVVFSGHVHNYERYEHNDVHYIVSGGGGAEQCSVNRSGGDFYNQPGETFHYCKITVSKAALKFEMVRLVEDASRWEVADTFTITRTLTP